MKRHIIIAFLCYFCITCDLSAQVLLSDSKFNNIANLLKGEWALEEWAKSLQKTKSPFHAGGDAEITHLLFSVGKSGCSVDEVINRFHEGTGNRSFKDIIYEKYNSNKVYKLLGGYREQIVSSTVLDRSDTLNNPVIASIVFLGRDRIRYTTDKYMHDRKTAVYVKCKPSIIVFANRTTVAGNFHDGNGASYRFNEDGKGLWNGREISYEVSIDNAFAGDIDIIKLNFPGKKNVDYGFRNQEGIVKLYGLVQSENCGDVMNQGKLFITLYPQHGVDK